MAGLSLAQVNTPRRNHVIGNRREVVTDFTCDTSYPTGGYALTAATLGVDLSLDFVQVSGSPGGYSFEYDYSAKKLKIWASQGTEVSNATDLHTLTGRLVAHGKGFGI